MFRHVTDHHVRRALIAGAVVCACSGGCQQQEHAAGGEGGTRAGRAAGDQSGGGRAGDGSQGGVAGDATSGAGGLSGTGGSAAASGTNDDAGLAHDAGADSARAAPDAANDAWLLPEDVKAQVAFWFDAALGVSADATGHVSKWADQSPASNAAIQTTAASQPTSVPTIVNGLPVVRFTAPAFLRIADSTSLHWGKGDFLVLFVVAVHNQFSANGSNKFDGAGTLFSKAPGGAAGDLSLYAGWPAKRLQYHAQAGAEADPGPFSAASVIDNDGQFRVVGMRRTVGAGGASRVLEVRINGAVSGSTMADSVADVSGSSDALLGKSAGAAVPLEGDIAEAFAIAGVVNATELKTIEDHLMAKYGLH